MDNDLRHDRSYLTPPKHSFWQWDEQGAVITWTDGQTICFLDELAPILEALTPQGLPPFGSILLLLSVTRKGWNKSLNRSDILSECLRRSDETLEHQDLLNKVLKELDQVARLEPALRSTTQAKSTLIAVVTESWSQRIPAEKAEEIVEYVSDGLTDGISDPGDSKGPQSDGSQALLQDLRCLHAGMGRIDPDVLVLRRRTGLNQLPKASKLDIPVADQVRTLLAKLEKDKQLDSLGNLAVQLIAVVSLSRPICKREQLPMGGVSDITNRGPIDHLLTSELVHNDLMLAIRIANQEALYLRHEMPPGEPPSQRALLLDSGLRMWGVPRVYGTAVALAFAATARQNAQWSVYRAKGQRVEVVDLMTREGIVAHLETLEPDLHPGEALETFQATTDKGVSEPIVITSEDVFEDNAFRQQITDSFLSPLLIATVHRNGSFRLREISKRGVRLIKEANLNLKEISNPPKHPSSVLIDSPSSRDLPALFRTRPFPLLLSHNLNPKGTWKVNEQGILSISKDRRLMFWSKLGVGARQITDQLPEVSLLWCSGDSVNGVIRAVVGRLGFGNFHSLQIDLGKFECISQRLPIERGVRSICVHAGVLFAISQRDVQVICLMTGKAIQTLGLPSRLTWHRDRFFQDPFSDCWYALYYDGRTARIESVWEKQKDRSFPNLITLFDRPGTDGPIGITPTGDLINTVTGAYEKTAHPLPEHAQVLGASPSGSRIRLGGPKKEKAWYHKVLDISTATGVAKVSHLNDSSVVMDPDIYKYVALNNLRNRFTRIYVDQQGVLILVSRKERCFSITYEASSGQIVLLPKKATASRGSKQSFKPVEEQPTNGFRLLRARWEDGSEAFLDSRGLLHLKSSHAFIPEVTIVLTDGPLAGWCSDGRWWGDAYYIDFQENASQKDAFDSSIRAFVRQLP